MITIRGRAALWLVLVVTLAGATPASRPTTVPAPLAPADLVAARTLAAEFADRLVKSRYMEVGEGVAVTVPGWEAFPTRRYTYVVTDKDGTRKSADVILLDPTADQIARWIVEALAELHGDYDPEAGRKAFRQILGQSGGQFPVRGVVYEDILPEDGKNELYCFRDGVTVAIEGVPHRGVEPLTDAQRQSSMTGRVTRVYRFGRISSTSPEMWIANGGDPAVLGEDGKPTQAWPDAVRRAYQAAWTADRNPLIVGWLKSPNG